MRVMFALAVAGATVVVTASRPASLAPDAANASLATPPQSLDPGLKTWTRLNGGRPILSPRGEGFEAAGVFNPAVIRKDDGLVMLYRAQDRKGTSRLGYATSRDGVDVRARDASRSCRPKPSTNAAAASRIRDSSRSAASFISPTPRTTARTRSSPWPRRPICGTGTRKGVIMPAYKGRWNVNWTKAGAILAQPIAGRYYMYYMGDARGRPDQTGIASSTDLVTWSDALDRPVLPRREGRFDSRVTEPGPPPIVTESGILLVYNGADDRLVYRTGWALFDRQDPTRLLARGEQPLFEPTTDWEKVGQVPNVVFVEGLVIEPTRWLVYYGGADKYVGAAAVARAPAVK